MSKTKRPPAPSKAELREQAAAALARTPEVKITRLPPGAAFGVGVKEDRD
jgi:hypothetical protein